MTICLSRRRRYRLLSPHKLDPGVAFQPSFDRGRFVVRQDIDDPPPFQIADHRSVTPTAPPGPVVDPDHPQMPWPV